MRNQDFNKMTISARRTLKSLNGALTELLTTKPLEKISIQELCDLAMISRGTFYNYFDDKYDLLNYNWKQIQLEIDPQYTHNLELISYSEYIHLFLKNFIVYLSKERDTYQMILSNNSNSIFSSNMYDYIDQQILLKLNNSKIHKNKEEIPLELLSSIYASTIIAVANWWIKSEEKYTEEDVYNFFTQMIETKNKIY